MTDSSGTNDPSAEKPIKVAILGGGIAALTAALALSEQRAGGGPRYEITIHQLGWRLGGKAATGRNRDMCDRIEEHGIHGFLGSYFNAIALMRSVFAELAVIAPQGFLTSFDDAFVGQNTVLRWEFLREQWLPWLTRMDKEPSPPKAVSGLGAGGSAASGIDGLLAEVSQALREEPLTSEFSRTMPTSQASQSSAAGKPPAQARSPGAPGSQQPSNEVAEAHRARGIARFMLGSPLLPDALRRSALLIDFKATLVIGIDADDLVSKGFDCIDHEDCDAWLKRHGASEQTRRSPLALVTPSITYNFPGGDMVNGARMSAAAFVQWNIALANMKDDFLLSFSAGTGESLIAPIYQLLKHRGVRFEFFHKVENLALNSNGSAVDRVDMTVQARTKSGGEYQPLYGPVKGLYCWPSKPLYEQLDRGDELAAAGYDLESSWSKWQGVESLALNRDVDFDHVILGIAIGALPFICGELIADQGNKAPDRMGGTGTRWQRMVDRVETVPTQAMQLWFKRPMSHYLRKVGFAADDAWLAGTYALPIAGQQDFSDLIPRESWPDADSGGPRGIMYFCGPLTDEWTSTFDDPDFPERQRERVRYQCIQYLQVASGALLPGAATNPMGGGHPALPGSLDFSNLHCANDPNATGEQRFLQQYWRANVQPSDRYVTCQPGAGRYRLAAGESGYTNLTLTGDWIYTGMNVGSLEGAVMSGMLAANALSGKPTLAEIKGYSGPNLSTASQP